MEVGTSEILVIFIIFPVAFAIEIATQPLMPAATPSIVPAIPFQSEIEACPLDLPEELFGGVKEACGRKELNRNKCCPVLAAWLYAAHARTALKTLNSPAISYDMPVLPDDSQTCVNNLQSSLQSRGIHLPQPNETCDPILCFCGIRLHRISSLSCPQAFNATAQPHSNVTTGTPVLRALERNCRTPTFSGCTRCLKTLHKLNGMAETEEASDRTSRINSRDCELMGLTWLLARNKTAYIPTVSAVFRAVMYSGLSPQTTSCSADHEKMPLAVDSSQLDQSAADFVRPTGALLLAASFVFHVTLSFRLPGSLF
eukprot:Gb_13120 [translate_table: standard]